jgi:hypothetical protein
MKIACLHTAQSNVAILEAAAASLGLPSGSLHHQVRADLLAAAELAGGLKPEIAEETKRVLLHLAAQSDAVLLSCSTLGPSVATIETTATPILRIDAALAEEAVRAGGRVVVLCAVETTLVPTTALFSEAARQTGASVDVRLVPGAWALFRAGDTAAYLASVASAADTAYREGPCVIALAQASMSAAAQLVTAGPAPMSSPTVGLAAIRELLR